MIFMELIDKKVTSDLPLKNFKNSLFCCVDCHFTMWTRDLGHILIYSSTHYMNISISIYPIINVGDRQSLQAEEWQNQYIVTCIGFFCRIYLEGDICMYISWWILFHSFTLRCFKWNASLCFATTKQKPSPMLLVSSGPTSRGLCWWL